MPGGTGQGLIAAAFGRERVSAPACPRSIVHPLLERLLGFADEKRETVDRALYALRIAVTHREPLLLCGEGNLVPIARQLHERALAGRPFVVARPRTRYARGMAALAEDLRRMVGRIAAC